MRKIVPFLIIILSFPVLISWGPYGHERINHAAVLALPHPILPFFYNHIDYITHGGSMPDIRRNVLDDKAEVPRHYFDLENFVSADSMPATLKEAQQKYTEEFLQTNGVLPWYIQKMMEELTTAFRKQDKQSILFIAADLGHYIADAHTPLHTTVNYNGQLTGQEGIHSFWETRLAEQLGGGFNYNPGQVVYIEDIPGETWRIINASNSLVEPLLLADKELNQLLPADSLYLMDENGKKITNRAGVPIYSDRYVELYNIRTNGMVEKQLRLALNATASYWYTAWVNAGKPDLSSLDPVDQTRKNKCRLKKELRLVKKGKLIDIKS